MSKTAEEIGLIVGGIALATVGILAGPAGIIALQGSASMYSAMIGIGLSTALSGVGLALRPQTTPVGAANTLSLTQGPAPRRVIYGQFQTASVTTYASFPPSQNQASTNQFLHLVYTLAAHEISSFDAVVINGTVYNFGTDLVWDSLGAGPLWYLQPGSSSAVNDFYWKHMFFEFDFGRPNLGGGLGPQPFPALAAADPTWTSACVQQGCAKVHVILRYDTSVTALFPSGQIPNIQFLVTGKKLIDTRIVTAWQPSANYLKYNYIVDNNQIVWVQQNASGVSGAARPNFETGGSTTLVDGSCVWKSSTLSMPVISQGIDSGPQGHTLNGRLVNDAWAPGVGFNLGAVIEAPLGYLQQQTSASGTVGSSEPAFSTTLGGATADGSQSWVCLGRSWHSINPSNPALVTNDYLQNTDWGMKAPASTIDASSVSAAANVCEEQQLIIWNADNTVVYENRYSATGMFDFTSTRGDVLASLCASMAGWVIPPGDLWHVTAGSFQTPAISLGDSDMRGPIKGDFRLSARDLLNTVGATYTPAFLPTNPGGATSLTQVPATWSSQSAPEYQANGLAGKPNYLNSEDGGQVLRLKLQLDFTTSLWTAQRLEKIALMRTRFPQTLTLPCKTIALQIEAGDAFSYTHARWGIEEQTFEATQASVTFDAGDGRDDVPSLGVDLIARQTDPSIYEFQGPTSASNYGEYSPYGITGVMTGVE
jgi:hypothetical protein